MLSELKKANNSFDADKFEADYLFKELEKVYITLRGVRPEGIDISYTKQYECLL